MDDDTVELAVKILASEEYRDKLLRLYGTFKKLCEVKEFYDRFRVTIRAI
jgi:hypothetical protein